MSGCTGQSPPDSVCPVASLFLLLFNLYTGYLILNQFLHPFMRMSVKRLAKRSTHPLNSSNTSSGGAEDFIVSPRPRRSTTHTGKAPRCSGAASSSQHAAQHEEDESSDAIQKVISPLKPNYLYTFRRVDHHHPQRPTYFTRKENHSMIQRNKDPHVWVPDLHDHRFWNNFQADWYIKVIEDRKQPITPHFYVDWPGMI
jgi:hypothetical protein